MFCSNIVEIINSAPFALPSVPTIAADVKPKQKPLYNINKYISGIPITVSPKNHNIEAVIVFFATAFASNFVCDNFLL